MKNYTDIEQSKKLADILPLESADMWYHGHYSPWKSEREYDDEPCPFHSMRPNWDKQCWSLTALLDVLPNEIITDNRFECHYQIHIRKYNGGDNTTLYQIAYGNDRGSSGSWHDMINTGEKDNLVDACYQMIIRLKELKML